MKKYIWTLLILVAVGVPAQAQDAFTLATYQISVPLGDTKDYIDKTSFRGIGLDIRKFMGGDHKLSLGGSVGWNVFDSGAITETINIDSEELDGDVTGTQFRYMNSFPLMFQVHYYLGDPGNVNAYVGTGVGLYYIKQRFEIGLVVVEANNWHFGFAPEAGVNVPVSDSIAFNANVRYNYAASSGEDIRGNSTGYQYFGFNLGLAFYNDIF